MIVVRIYEGLGNQMFAYAYAYALSKRKKFKNKVYIDIRNEAINELDDVRIYRPITIDKFQLTLPVINNNIAKKWDYLKKAILIHKFIYVFAKRGIWKYKFMTESDYNFNKNNFRLKNNLYVVGWFQHYEYFKNVRSDLLKEFTLKQEFTEPQALKKIMKNYEVVSIHVRRGDYISNRMARKVMGICNEDYYEKAVEYINKKIENIYLFIFTDDEQWVKQTLKLSVPSIVISNHYGLTDEQELVLMSRCKHNIIANSTFSWWGAWLNTNKEKIVIAPKRWFADSRRKNIALKEWIKL